MNRYLLAFALLVAFAFAPAIANANSYDQPDIIATDILTAVIPLTGLTIAYFRNDHEGTRQWMRNTALNQVLVSGLRLGFNETSLGERPNGGLYGFPSGHMAFVMSGATFLGERYGWQWGLPAYVGAAFVGYTRVEEDKHHWRDILASSVLAYGVAKLTVTPEHATYLAPIIGPNFIGMRWERSY